MFSDHDEAAQTWRHRVFKRHGRGEMHGETRRGYSAYAHVTMGERTSVLDGGGLSSSICLLPRCGPHELSAKLAHGHHAGVLAKTAWQDEAARAMPRLSRRVLEAKQR